MVSSYQKLFLPFARRRLFNPQDVEDCSPKLWEELMNGQGHFAATLPADGAPNLLTWLLPGHLLHPAASLIGTGKFSQWKGNVLAAGKSSHCHPGDTPDHLLEQSTSDHLARSLVHAALVRLATLAPGMRSCSLAPGWYEL